MATLPPKPEPGEISTPTPPAEDRRSVARPTPMAPPSQYQRSDRPSRDDVYIPQSSSGPRARGPSYGDSYATSDARRQDEYRRDYADWDRRREDDYRSGYDRDRRGDRRPYDSRRAWDEYDRSRDRDRDRDFDRRRPPPPRGRDFDDRDRRQWRSRTPPPRRAGQFVSELPPLPTHQSSLLLGPSDAGRRRSPMSPRRRPPSPTRSRATSRSKSRAPSPSSKVRLGSHSIASPNSLRKAPVSPRRRRSYSRSRSRTPPPRRRSFSRSPRRRSSPVDKRERYPSPSVPIDSPSRSHKTSRHQTPRRSRSRSRSPAPSPVKTEVAEDIVMSSVDTSAMEMGKVKEEENHLPPSAIATKIEADPDTKMNNPTPNIPTGPRNAGGPPREPPRGPRGYAQQPPPPTGPASRPTPTQPRNAVAQSTASGSTPARTEVALSPKTEPEAILPVIPPYRIKTTLQPEQDSEVRPSLLLISLWYSPLPQIARLRAQRANLTSEYANVSKATRRALHELEMASFDLRTAEKRRKLADTHLDMARMGVLGIDYVPNIV